MNEQRPTETPPARERREQHELSERVLRTEEALRESENRYRLLVEGAAGFAIILLDPEGRVKEWNVGARRIFGYEQREIVGEAFTRFFTEEDLAKGLPERELRQAREEDCGDDENQLVRKDGSRFWASGGTTTLRDTEGKLAGYAKFVRDVTDRREAEEALRERDRQFRRAIEEAPIPVILHTEDGAVLQVNRAWSDLTGYTAEDEAVFRRWLTEAYGGDIRSSAEQLLDSHDHLRSVELEITTRGGERRTWSYSATAPGRLRDGRIVVVGMAQDITDRRQRQERMQTLMAELNHRVRNMLAVIQAIAAQTLEHAPDAKTFTERFQQRLRAIAKAHALLTEAEWAGAPLGDIIRSEVGSGEDAEARCSVAGPPVRLTPEATLAMHMVVHELATNAVKYGALTCDEGRIEIGWDVDDGGGEPRVQLVWTERCVDPIRPPEKTGYGTQLIERLVEFELHGAVERTFRPQGLECRMSFPLAKAGAEARA